MSNKTTIPPAMQQRILRLQQLQQTLSVLLGERQRLDAELAEINNALSELVKVGDDAKVFKNETKQSSFQDIMGALRRTMVGAAAM